jgi:hypothetical protein
LKPERWGSLLVQENNQEGKACDKRRIIIIIIIIITLHPHPPTSENIHGAKVRS